MKLFFKDVIIIIIERAMRQTKLNLNNNNKRSMKERSSSKNLILKRYISEDRITFEKYLRRIFDRGT